MKKILTDQKGQLLIEILIAIAVVALIIGAVSNLFLVNLKNSRFSEGKNDALLLAQEGMEAMQAVAEKDWRNIYSPPSGSGNQITDKDDPNIYCLKIVSSLWTLAGPFPVSGPFPDCEIMLNDKKYTRKITIHNVKRNGGEISTEGQDDPSTQKIKIAVSYSDGKDVVLEKDLTRWKNEIFIQSDWLGGSGSGGPFNASNSIDMFDSSQDIVNPSGSIRLAPL